MKLDGVLQNTRHVAQGSVLCAAGCGTCVSTVALAVIALIAGLIVAAPFLIFAGPSHPGHVSFLLYKEYWFLFLCALPALLAAPMAAGCASLTAFSCGVGVHQFTKVKCAS